MPLPPWHPEAFAARLPFLERRARLTAETRAFLTARGYREVETPALVPAPGAEVHLRAFVTRYEAHLGQGASRDLWLRTSPELALKRLLVAGAGPVFEMARVWRNGETSPRHSPEFTMLEWYRPGLGFDGLIAETEEYIRTVAPQIVAHGAVTTDLSLTFERITMAEAFARWCNGLDILATEGDAARLQAASPYGRLPGWRAASFVVKAGDDLRREALAMQLVGLFRRVWAAAGVPAAGAAAAARAARGEAAPRGRGARASTFRRCQRPCRGNG
jgi:elongation factor P--beta-lysine ligase